jgi:SEL1 protein
MYRIVIVWVIVCCCCLLLLLLLDGLGVAKDFDKARKYWTLAANQENSQGQYHLAKMYHHGIGNVHSCATAVKLYKAVAEKGDWGNALTQALEYFHNDESDKAILLYEKLAHRGFEMAQHNAAWMYDSNKQSNALARNDTERYANALYYYRRAAEQGNSNAHLKLGDYYYYGHGGVTVDFEKAASYYRFASGMKNSQATFNIGLLHQFGQGVPQDLHLAKRYYDMSLEDNPDAFLAVSLMLVYWAAHYVVATVIALYTVIENGELGKTMQQGAEAMLNNANAALGGANGAGGFEVFGYQWDTIAITILCGILLIAMRNRIGRM